MVSYNVFSCWAQLISVFFFAGCLILSDSDLQIKKKTEATLPIENCIETDLKLLLGSPRELHQLSG